VLAARLAGDPSREDAWRAFGAAACVPLGVGVYVSFSRGAIVALALGLAVLILVMPNRVQLRAIGLCLAFAVPAVIVAGLMPGVRGLSGSMGAREAQGAVMLVVLLALVAGAAFAYMRFLRGSFPAPLNLPRRAPIYVALAVVILGGAGLAAALHERNGTANPAFGANNSRLASVETNRTAYWKVALRTFVHHPLKGHGSSSFQVDWARERTIRDPAKDAHSLYLETAAELGIVGLLLLASLFVGVGASAVRAHRRLPELSAGWIAAACAWAVHAGLDWDWEMPAVTLIALVLAGALVAWGDEARPVGAEAAEARLPEPVGTSA
jgi:O-antigen ligase/polysaccharide polymerase Wzy-like membrane protein